MFSDTLAGAPAPTSIDPTPPPPPVEPERPRRRIFPIAAGMAAAVLAVTVGLTVANGDDGSDTTAATPSGAPAPNAACRPDQVGNRTVLHDPVLACSKTDDGYRWLTTGDALASTAEGRSIQGEFSLIDSDLLDVGSVGCAGSGGYSDISSSTQVVVKNGKGDILGVTNLGAGSKSIVTCTFNWVIDELPKESFYVVEVGRRGSLTFSAAELASRGWKVSSTLGS